MRIGEKHEETRKHNATYDDFASIMEESWFDKLKPILKVTAVIIILSGIGYGAYAWSTHSTAPRSEASSYTPLTAETDSDTGNKVQEATTDQTANSAAKEDSAAYSQISSSSTNSNAATPTQTSSYDPHKCDSLNAEASRLRTIAEQKKATYDNAFATRQLYGYFYDKYSNKTDADLAYKAQEARLDELQTEWNEALTAGNAAYEKYQSCQSANLTQ